MSSNDNIIETHEDEEKGLRLIIELDMVPVDPRSWDNLGTLLIWHRRYRMGDENPYETPADFREEINYNNAIILPVYMYDHSGVSLSTSNNYPFSDPWDAGQAGYIYVTKDKIRKEYNVKRISKQLIQKVIGYMNEEIKTFNEYLSGSVYGFRVEKKNVCPHCGHVEWEILDSCYGFYGNDWEANGLKDTISDDYKYLLDLPETEA